MTKGPSLYDRNGRLVATGLVPAAGQSDDELVREAEVAWGLQPGECHLGPQARLAERIRLTVTQYGTDQPAAAGSVEAIVNAEGRRRDRYLVLGGLSFLAAAFLAAGLGSGWWVLLVAGLAALAVPVGSAVIRTVSWPAGDPRSGRRRKARPDAE